LSLNYFRFARLCFYVSMLVAVAGAIAWEVSTEVTYPRLIAAGLVAVFFVVLSGWLLMITQHHETTHNASEAILNDAAKDVDPALLDQIPGWSFITYIRFQNNPESRKAYFLDVGKAAGPRVSIYISPEDIFTVAFMDSKSELYSIRVPMGTADGIPFNRFVALCCSIGVTAQGSVIAIMMDGKVLGKITFAFRIDMKELPIPGSALGSDLQEKNGGFFDLVEQLVYGNRQSFENMQQLTVYLVEKHGQAPRGMIQFAGKQSMRVIDPAKSPRPKIPEANTNHNR